VHHRGVSDPTPAQPTPAEPTRFERGTDGPRVVLVGVDGSPTSLRAAAYAAGLARRQGSRLVVVFVVAPAAVAGWSPYAGPAIAGAAEEVDAELRREVQAGAHQLGIRVEYRTLHGDPVAELTRVADEVLADAVVVGASEQAGHRVVGSVAVRLVKAGHWPVTVVP
jgi:nucleotide-binding universal stress UspA family protein